MTIREYLSREAARITAGALSDATDRASWERSLPERRRRYREMTGLDRMPLPGRDERVPFTVTGVVERGAYRIEKLYYESLPGLLVTANLYVPNGLDKPAPGVVYACGHAQNQKVWYQAHPRRFAELGFVCLLVETVQLGEVTGYHHGPYREGWFHWYSRGYTPAGIEAAGGIRALDLLAQRDDVDGTKLGFTGISGGGTATWWTAAADERVKAAAPVCGTATLEAHIGDRLIDHHCDCMWWSNYYQWDMADVAALIAPRPLMIASGDRDSLNSIASIKKVHEQTARVYELLGASENLRLIDTPGPHAYHKKSRTEIFSWFIKHLMGKDIPPAQVGDIDDSPEKQESVETLRVYVNGSPPGNKTPTIQDDLFTPPALPPIKDTESLQKARQDVVNALRETTFRAFPPDPPPLDDRMEYEFLYKTGRMGCRFGFTSEEGWRLHGRLLGPTRKEIMTQPAQTVLVTLASPGDALEEAEAFAGKIPLRDAAIASVEPRGTGDTAWGQELQWHIRRAAAWTGRTIASMRVWDTLRGLEAVRKLPGVAPGARISLAARGEMAAVALYAALLDGNIDTLFLSAPPATQNAPGSPDGKGDAIEMSGCLRITDLPQVAGLLFPTQIVVTGDCPDFSELPQNLYRELGKPESFRRVNDWAEWQG